jgi:hypothetical protein
MATGDLRTLYTDCRGHGRQPPRRERVPSSITGGCECAEHDALLASRDLDSLRVEDVHNAGWDPICFVTAASFRYYLPALRRLAFESAITEDWYLPQLLFHLIGDGPQNRRVMGCTAAQQRAVAAALWHVVETRPELIVRCEIANDLQKALEIWSAPAS